MLKKLADKWKEALFSVLPVTAIVFLIELTPAVSLTGKELAVFAVCSLFMILGIGLFNLGADMAMVPMGEQVGAGLTRLKKPAVLLFACFLMGVFITVAEPDLSVLAGQVRELVSPTVLTAAVGIGVGLFLLIAVLRIFVKKPLSSLLMFFYMVLFALAAVITVRGGEGFLSLAFDSGGVTTGPITVPFIMALCMGIASTVGGRNVGENSFGMVSLCSAGPILAVLALGILSQGEVNYRLPDYSMESRLGDALFGSVLSVLGEVVFAVGLILLFFGLLQVLFLRLPRRKLLQILCGILYTVAGLVIFLSAVNIGFMPVGFRIGTALAQTGNRFLIVGIGFLLGLVTVLAEPAIHVLNKQVESVTNGAVKQRSMMIALSVGVGLSIGLSLLRILLGFNILYYVVPGYLISFGLSFFVPGIYTAIAFDSGGVASGPLTSGFILPLAIGVCCSFSGESRVLTDAFGVVAMVAMTPLISIQLLGFRAVVRKRLGERIAMRRILGADDCQIIRFR